MKFIIIFIVAFAAAINFVEAGNATTTSLHPTPNTLGDQVSEDVSPIANTSLSTAAVVVVPKTPSPAITISNAPPPLPRDTIFPTEALPVTPVSVNAFLLLSGIFADLLLELGVLFGSLIYCIQIYYSHTSVVFFTCFKIIPFPTNILDRPHIR